MKLRNQKNKQSENLHFINKLKSLNIQIQIKNAFLSQVKEKENNLA